MTTHGDNPAARVKWFLTGLRDGGHRPEARLVDAATDLLFEPGAQPVPTELLMTRLIDVITQGQLAREAIDRLPEDANAALLLRHYDEVDAALANLHIPWHLQLNGVLGRIERSGWHALDVAVDLLHRYAREPVIAEDKIKTLREQTTDLIEAVIAADDLDNETKLWLLGKLREVREALENVDVLGYGGVERAYDGVLGGAIHSPGRIARIRASKVWSGFADLMRFLSAAIKTAEGVRAIAAGTVTPEHIEGVLRDFTEIAGVVGAPAIESAPDDEGDGSG